MGCRGVHLLVIWSKALLRATLLYGALAAMTSAPAQTPPAPAEKPSHVPMPLGVDMPHIALLLPVDSSIFRRHAEALRDGLLAASKIPDPPTLPIRVYPVGEDPKQAVASYKKATESGARLVIGPLIRSAAGAVAAGAISVPTLLLNAPESAWPNKAHLYVISLQIETEARQAAQLAFREGRRNAYTVVGESQLLRRVNRAFLEEFIKLGGKHPSEFLYNTSPAELARLKQAVESRAADMAFLALDAHQARGVRATLGALALYASSQAYSGDLGAADLAGIRILDLPWLLQRDHPAVRIYPRQDFGGDTDLDRLYALGIDAWRIGQALLARHSDITLDGVTGKLTLGRDRQFARGLASIRLGDKVPDAPLKPAVAATLTPVKPAGAVAPAPAPAKKP